MHRDADAGQRPRWGTPLLAAAAAAVLIATAGCGLVSAPANGGQTTAGAAQPAAPASPNGSQPAATAGPGGLPAGSFVALAGYGCPQSSQARFIEAGQYTDGISGFLKVPTGGWYKQGCDGRFDAMPMSGSATEPDPGNYALWSFRTAPLVTGTCQVGVYVPADRSIEHVGGDPAKYQVYDAPAASGTPVGAFAIDDLTRQGSWVSGGSYPLTGGVLTVKLSSAGVDWHGNVSTYAHLPVSQVMAFCHSRA